ncbi:XerC Integrase [Candidatus Nanopelagicaceae bacterium]
MTNIINTIAELKAQLPNASDETIAQLAAKHESAPTRLVNGKKVDVPTIAAMLDEARERVMGKERRRKRARVQADGSMKVRDTSTLRTYSSHWTALEEAHGDLLITDITEKQLLALAEQARQAAITWGVKRNEKRRKKQMSEFDWDGSTAFKSRLTAYAAAFGFAVKSGQLEKNPVTPLFEDTQRLASFRYALSPTEVDELMQVAQNGGDDPVLDHLILWTLLETACRAGGVMKMQLQDIDVDQQLLVLSEKRSKSRYQPVTKELAKALVDFAKSRGAIRPTDAVFRFQHTSRSACLPINHRRLDTMWARIYKQLRWAEEKCVTAHTLRHTTLTYVDRAVSPTVARLFAGHGLDTTTEHYTKVTVPEVCRAHEIIFARQHPKTSV